MKKNPFKLSPIIFLAISFSLFFGCKKFEEYKLKKSYSTNTQSTYSIRLTDAPGDYDQVNIDIDSVLINTNKGQVVSLNVNSGIYNLLDFQNGIDTLIAQASLDSCTVSQIRLVLGSRNTVMVDSMIYPLSTPSAQTSGLKIQVHHVLRLGVDFAVILDFDAKKSIIQTGSGKYKLKPVIKTLN